MHSLPKRLSAWALSLLILLALPGAFAEESAEAMDWGEGIDSRFFVPEDEVTTDAAGEPVLVRGYPFRRVRAAYFDKGQGSEYGFDVDFVDYPFWSASTEYDGNLAVMSLAMALSASRPLAAAGDDPSQNLERFLGEAGFGNIRKDDYSKTPSMYTVSTAMGSRVMEAEGEEPFTLIAIGVCGSNYQNEWQSNLSPGNGDVHEGFAGAAQLVLDRLAGYIATGGIRGRVKVWISGFSRAAAVSNLAAAAMTDSGWLAQEDVYAYTFATPAAVKDPPETGYEHIWNIICPTDPVPQVMPADWGFGRYGRDRYLPVQEFSSFTGGIATQVRAETDREVYGVENRYSPELNLRIRLLLSLVMDAVESQAHFNETFQPALVGIMQNKTIPNTLTTLRDVMMAAETGSEAQRANVDELMDYLIRVFSSSLTRSGLGANDRNSAGTLYRLFNEHNENSYLAGLSLLQAELFEPGETTNYVFVRGPVTVTLEAGSPERGIVEIVRITADGEKAFLLSDDPDDPETENLYYLERCGNTTVLAVPSDLDYRVAWTAERTGEVACMQATASVRVSARYPGAVSAPVRVQAGDSGIAYEQVKGENILPEGFAAQTLDAMQLARFMGIVSLGINWRVGLTAATALPALLLCAVLCLLASRKPTRRKQYGFLTRASLCLFGAASLETEIAYWFFADRPLIRLAWKAVIGVCLVVVFFRVHRPRERLPKTLLPGLVLACCADLAISLHFVAGVALFAAFHLVLIRWLQRTTPMSRGRWIQWLAVSLPVGAVIVVLFRRTVGPVAWGVGVYGAVLLLMVFSSNGQPIRVRLAAILFFVSDLLLGLFGTLMPHPAIHAVYMFLFYAALLLLAIHDERQRAGEVTDAASRTSP